MIDLYSVKLRKVTAAILLGKMSLNAWEFSHSPPPSPAPLPPPPTHFFSAFETLRKGGGGGGGGVEGEEGGGKAVEGTPGLLLSHKPGYRPSKKERWSCFKLHDCNFLNNVGKR